MWVLFMFGRGDGQYIPDTENWLFPKLASLGNTACTKVSGFLTLHHRQTASSSVCQF
jgi:hypothetical protein